LLKKIKQIISLVVSNGIMLSLQSFNLKTVLLQIKNLVFITLVMHYVVPGIAATSHKLVVEITQGETSETNEFLENEDASEKELSVISANTGVTIQYVAGIWKNNKIDKISSASVRLLKPPPKA